jgi:MYXO-CTERM domain-containing protein
VTWFGVSSVSVPGNNICGQDLSALQLSTSIPDVCPLIPRVDTDLTDNETYSAIGFGITSPNGTMAGTRYRVDGMTVQCVNDCNDPTQSASLEWRGGATSAVGTCEGDSGGPAIDAAKRVTGGVSRGAAGACNTTVYESVYGNATWIKQMATQAAQAGGYAVAGWVTGSDTSNPASGYCSVAVGDAGADAGGSDGGTSDGGTSDGGATDAGAADASSGSDAAAHAASDAAIDASAADASSGSDSGLADAALPPSDASGSHSGSGGCSCSMSGFANGTSPGFFGVVAVLAGVLARARRRRRETR